MEERILGYLNLIIFNCFIETRTSGSREIWQLIQNACDADHETAKALIEAAGLYMP